VTVLTIGFLELNSIARGVEAADSMLKAADVRLLFARPTCPGKYNVLVAGDVAAVTAAVEAGVETGRQAVVEQLVIPRIHPQVIHAVNLSAMPERAGAVGVMEYFSITGAILGADDAVKAAEVELVDVRLGTGIGGKSFVVLTGDTAAVSHAVVSGSAKAAADGMLIDTAVIPNPAPGLLESLL